MSKGIEVRQGKTGASIRVRFSYRGREFREILRMEPTKANLAYAERLRGEIINQLERGTFDYRKAFPSGKNAAAFGQPTGAETVGGRLDEYIAQCELATERGNMSPSTLRNYSSIVRNVLQPYFGKIKVEDLNVGHIRDWVEERGVTQKTIRNWIRPLRAAMDDAVADRAILQSPVRDFRLRRASDLLTKKSEFEPDPFLPQEVEQILQHAGPHRPLFQFAFATGLRTSELMAIQWADIDMKARTANVDKAMIEKTIKAPKTRSGVRVVDLSDAAIDALKRIPHQVGILFPNPNTKKAYARENTIRKAWVVILKKAGVKYRNPYQTRHTFASTLLSSGANPWYVAQQMGHKTVEMVFRHYGRWLPLNFRVPAQLPPDKMADIR